MIDPPAQQYLDAIPERQRALFDRIHGLILDECPAADVTIAYKMPTYTNGGNRLHVAAWKHGVSLYGWNEEDDGGFVERHPESSSGKGTIRLRTDDADAVADDEIRALVRGALVEK